MIAPRYRLVLLVVALVLAFVFTLCGFDVIGTAHPLGWLGATLVAFIAAFV